MSDIKKDFFNDSKLFSKSLGSLLHEYMGDAGITFERDMQLFLYGRYSILNKNTQIHNNVGFGVNEAAYYLGGAFASFIQNLEETSAEMGQPLTEEDIKKLQDLFREEVIKGFNDKIEILLKDPESITVTLDTKH